MTTDLNTLREALEPCPWCGEPMAHVVVIEGSTFRWRKVQGCCADGPEVRHDTLDKDQTAAEANSRARAIAAWNRRVPVSRLEAAADHIVDANKKVPELSREDVVRLAKEAGIETNLVKMGAASLVYTKGVAGVTWGQFERFASLVRSVPVGEEAKRQAAITAVYDKLHDGKLGAHWLWCVIEQIAAGVPEAEAMRDFGYYTKSLVGEVKPVAWCDERVIQWLADHPRSAGITTKLTASKSIERPAPLYATQPAPPDGWKPVPVEPTCDMLAAMSGEWHPSRHGKAREQYAAMLAAAPQPGDKA